MAVLGDSHKESLEIDDLTSSKSAALPKLSHGGTSTIIEASFNQTNAVVGVGILYIAEGFQKGGIVLFLSLFLIIGIGVYYTSNLLVESAEECGVYNYYDLAAEMVGGWAYYALCFFCIVLNFGACLGYLATIQNMVPTALRDVLLKAGLSESVTQNWLFSDMGFMWVILLIIVPLSLIKDMDSLSWVSTLKVGVLAVVTIVIFWQGNTQSLKDFQNIKTWNTDDVVYFFREAKGDGTIYKALKTMSPDGNTYIARIRATYDAAPSGDDDLTKYNQVTQILKDAEDAQTPGSVAKTKLHDIRVEKWEKLKAKRTGAGSKVNWWAARTWWLQLGTAMFSIVYHDSVFPIYKSMAEPTVANWKCASSIGTSLVSGIHICYGIFAYLIFRNNLPDMILTADPFNAAFPCNVWTNMIRLMFGILLILTYPICNLLCRVYVEAVLQRIQGKSNDEPDYPWTIRWLITGCVLLVSYVIIALGGADQATTFIEIAGGLGAGMIAFFMPAIIYFQVFGYEKIKLQTCDILSNKDAGCCAKVSAIFNLTLPIITCVIGTLASLFATVVAIIRAINPDFGLGGPERIPVGS